MIGVASLCFSVTKTYGNRVLWHLTTANTLQRHFHPTLQSSVIRSTMTTERNNKGGRPKLADYQKRTKMVRVMFCENDFIYLQSKAAKAGLSVGEYCHQAAMDNTVREMVSPELAKGIRDLSGIANNVNQMAHQMHVFGLDAVKEECIGIIAAM